MTGPEEVRKISLEFSIWYYKEVVGKPIFIDKERRKESQPPIPEEVTKTADLFNRFIAYGSVPE